MYRITGFLLALSTLGFSLAACEQTPSALDSVNQEPPVTRQITVSDVNPALPLPVHAKTRSDTTSLINTAVSEAATTSEVVNDKDYIVVLDRGIFMPCCDNPTDIYIFGYAHLVVTPSGQIHLNSNGSDFYANDYYSGNQFRGTGKLINNEGIDGSNGRAKVKAKIKFTDANGCVFYYTLYFHLVEGEPQVHESVITCDE